MHSKDHTPECSEARILALVGLCGSGKSFVAEYLIKAKYQVVYFGQIALDELRKQNLEKNETNERKIRHALRAEHGMEAYAKLSTGRIDSLRTQGAVLIDGLYSFSEYTFLRARYPSLFVLAVVAPKALRYARLSQRSIRPLTPEEAEARDLDEVLHIEKAQPIALADYTILNDGSPEDLREQLQRFEEYYARYHNAKYSVRS